ncbi:non-specific lipid-transfer protein-like protein [Tripterygium wilfordii]|uniref:Non-specific lipid-transfer protein-like protein n=1 Tax=Tripterygium wilfordii TaxID=458696 RepID=A0A7J7DCY3_TRIWF|nr:non-specific lipid transfer protein GPI-anchored 31-like [Tripterygium wilfordii]KAF5743926.1 non-specific lipid-transfer protein-like protein [Tripterygium wilfordii]
MAAVKACLLLCVLSVLSICAVDGAGHSHTVAAPAPSVDCSMLIMNMADCLPFVSNGSGPSKPEKTCCTGFKTVLKADPDCICQAFKSSAQFGVVIDIKRAMALPAACGVHDSSAPTCGMSLSPASAPETSPTLSGLGPTSAQSVTPAPAPKSSSSALSSSVASLVLGLVAAAFSSF